MANIRKVKGINYNLGDTIGNCKYIEEVTGKYRRFVKVQCYCGKVFISRHSVILTGSGCGCKGGLGRYRDVVTNEGARFVASNIPEYWIWAKMFDRCNNPKNKSYKRYGGRGIKISEEWRDFYIFYLDIGKRPNKNYSIERIDVNGNYCKENCKWATKKEQANNRRTNHFLSYNGQIKTIAEWSDIIKISPRSIYSRFVYGWSTEKILTTPLLRKRVKSQYKT